MPGSEIILYQSDDGATKIDVRLEGETVIWQGGAFGGFAYFC